MNLRQAERELAAIAAALPGWASDTSDVPLSALVKACVDRLQIELQAAQLALHVARCERNDALGAAPPAALPAETPRAETWQPIETAPKMRKLIVSYVNACGKRRCVMACYYLANALEMDDDHAEVGIFDEASGTSYAPEGWYEEHDSEEPLMPLQEQPTHWQPLPAPPQASRAVEGDAPEPTR